MSSFEEQLRAELAEKENLALRRRVRAVPDGVLDLASNDYLGLARHPEVIEAACVALRTYGAGARASRLVSGHTALHEQLENALAAFKNCEAALVFPSGYHANLSTITALSRRGDVIFCDKRNHASLIDACRLASAQGATVRFYTSLDRLQKLLQEYQSKRRDERFLIVSDTIYSMDGDLADVPQLTQTAAEFEAVLILDDAHGTGVMDAGRKAKIADTVQVGTLSKALSAQGGFVVGSRVLIDWLINAARPFIYTTGLAPSACGAALKALEIVQREPERRLRLRAVSEQLVNGLRALGFDARLQISPIIPVMVGEAERAVALSQKLLEYGVWCPAIRPPTVPAGSSRLRLTASAVLTDGEIQRALNSFAAARVDVKT